MPRSATPARATKLLVEQLRGRGVEISPRRLEDWGRLGLVPKPERLALGRGRGTATRYPADIGERCEQVARRMRRGQPWQVAVLLLFADGVELPEKTVRGAYRWAYTPLKPQAADELDAAERAIDQMLRTVAGRRVERVIRAHLRRAGLVGQESTSAVARSVHTSLFLSPAGGVIANEETVVEVLAGTGIPIGKLGEEERSEAARCMTVVFDQFSVEELAETIDHVSIDQLRAAVSVAAEALSLLPDELRAAIPPRVSEFLVAAVPPVILYARSLAEQLLGENVTSTEFEQGRLPNGATTTEAMAPLTSRRSVGSEPKVLGG